MAIEAFFWDYDNTILETCEAHWKKHQVVLSQQGIQLNDKFRQRLYENNGSQNWEWMQEELGLKVPEEEYLAAIDSEFQRHLSDLEERPGVMEVLETLAKRGVPQAIITNARRNSAEPVLRKKSILAYMKFVLYKEDYKGRKPEPTPYLEGFKKMGEILGKVIDPKKCIVVEDDPKGVESAHKAGAIVIQRKLHENDLDSPYADYTCFQQNDFIAIIENLLKTTGCG